MYNVMYTYRVGAGSCSLDASLPTPQIRFNRATKLISNWNTLIIRLHRNPLEPDVPELIDKL